MSGAKIRDSYTGRCCHCIGDRCASKSGVLTLASVEPCSSIVVPSPGRADVAFHYCSGSFTLTSNVHAAQHAFSLIFDYMPSR